MEEWKTEPDFVRWLDPATGLRCVVLRGPVGALNGYVAVPPGPLLRKLSTKVRKPALRALMRKNVHSVHNMPAYDKSVLRRVRVHGGLTFSGRFKTIPRMGNAFWLGFDTAHAGDYCPDLVDVLAKLGHRVEHHKQDTYRNIEYVKAECTQLAAQIRKLIDKGA